MTTDHPHHTEATPPSRGAGKIGVLLVNLGTPEGTDYWAMRRYLKEFLWDPRVVEVPRPLWWLILHGPILTFRPKKSGRAYAAIWDKETDESPLRRITRQTAEKLAARFEDQPDLQVDWAMRYGRPAIAEALARLQAAGCERILLFPLYPQYSATTTATACDAAFAALAKMRHQPTLRVVPPYYAEPAYIAALASEAKRALTAAAFSPDAVLVSFHGLPADYAQKGDPYPAHCRQTADLLRDAMGMPERKFHVSFQSRMGRGEWLRPYTDETLAKLGQAGVKRLAVIMPGFAADCLETLEEIAMGGAEIFRKHGGEAFLALPCLNDSEAAIDLYAGIIRRELQGWLSPEAP